MALIIHGKDFAPAPEGMWAAVCVDVIDKGEVETTWGLKPKVRIVWEIESLMDDGRRFIIGKTYTSSLHEKATLRKDLKGWRGRDFTADELRAFDLETVLGAPARLLVQHDEREGIVYANVTAVLKAEPKRRLTASGTYTRKPAQAPSEPPADADVSFPGDDEPVSF